MSCFFPSSPVILHHLPDTFIDDVSVRASYHTRHYPSHASFIFMLYVVLISLLALLFASPPCNALMFNTYCWTRSAPCLFGLMMYLKSQAKKPCGC